jgi:hypothetical protein
LQSVTQAIRETAHDLCPRYNDSGQQIQTSGEVNAKVEGVVSKLLNVLFAGQAEEKKEEYRGPVRTQIVDAIKFTIDCNTTVMQAVIGLVTRFPPSGPIPSPTAVATPTAKQVYQVCHGEIESTCKQHAYTVFEMCSDKNGVGGANPAISCQTLCGEPLGQNSCEARGLFPGFGGNHCGYSWFEIRCY